MTRVSWISIAAFAVLGIVLNRLIEGIWVWALVFVLLIIALTAIRRATLK